MTNAERTLWLAQHANDNMDVINTNMAGLFIVLLFAVIALLTFVGMVDIIIRAIYTVYKNHKDKKNENVRNDDSI